MANMHTAVATLEAELEHAKQGKEYYTARVAMLTELIDKAKAVEDLDDVGSSPRGKARGRRAGTKPSSTSISTRQKANGNGLSDLPKTGKDFWLGLIDSTPLHASQIFEAAVKNLKSELSAEARKKLYARMSATLKDLVNRNALKHEGKGRRGTYAKA